MATILELAELSSAVYGDAPVPSGWKQIQVSGPASDGYLGVAYVNTTSTTHEIVIANRGTRRTSLADLLNDAGLLAHQVTPDETSAITFANQIVNLIQPGGPYAGYHLIETGHSLGGAEAQAATAALVKTMPSLPISAVTFNAPGITSQLFTAGISYNVLNLYAQGDIIHTFGGTHLGTTALMATGPTLTQEYDALAAGAVTGGLLGGPGLAWLLGGVAWAHDVLQAHSIKTAVGYLQGSPIGLETEAQFIHNLTQPSGPSSGVSLSSSALGQFSLTGTNGTFSFDVPNSQGLTFSFQPGSTALPGSSMAFAQELANAGPINLPTQELNQILNSSSGVTDIFAVANGSSTIDYFTLPGGPGANPSINQVAVGETGVPVFDYNVPTGSQPMVEYIQDDGGNGSVSVNNGQALTLLTGGTPVAGTPWTWTDTHGTQYVFAPSASANPNVGTLTISGGLLGATAGNQIVIENFNLNTAETQPKGDLGLQFTEQVAVAADPSLASDPFRSGDYTPPNGAVTVSQGVAQNLTINVSAVSSSPQPVTLSFSGGNLSAFAVDTGAVLLPLTNGSVTLTVPAGADSLTVDLVATQDLTANETLSEEEPMSRCRAMTRPVPTPRGSTDGPGRRSPASARGPCGETSRRIIPWPRGLHTVLLVGLALSPLASCTAFAGHHIRVVRSFFLERGHPVQPYALARTRTGGYVIAGTMGGPWAIRVSRQGQVVWRYRLPFNATRRGQMSGDSRYTGAVTLPDDSTLLCGFGNFSPQSIPDLRGILTHLSPTGQVLSTQILYPDNDRHYALNYLNHCVRSGKGVVVVGSTTRFRKQGASTSYVWLLKLDAHGRIEWQKLMPDRYANFDPDQTLLALSNGDLAIMTSLAHLRLVGPQGTVRAQRTIPFGLVAPSIRPERAVHVLTGGKHITPAWLTLGVICRRRTSYRSPGPSHRSFRIKKPTASRTAPWCSSAIPRLPNTAACWSRALRG
ncbi:MAG: lipase family protein [Acidiferrobacteraceae bacterium]